MTKIIQAILKFLFSRIVITATLVALQAYVIFASFYRLSEYWSAISILLNLLSAFLVIYIINRDQNPAFKLAWVIPICAFPLLGGLLYLYVETNMVTYGIRHAVNKRIAETKPYMQQDALIRRKLNEKSCSLSAISRYLENVGNYPTYENTKVKYYPNGAAKFDDMMEDLKKAEKFILLEYFIIAEGYMWDSVLNLLAEKVKQGVEVKVMFDGTCFLYHLPIGYEKKIMARGIETQIFLPVTPIFSTHQNYRDHRKILVIDGKAAYNGGINLADEYMNLKEVHGKWKDTAVRVTGDAVKSYTIMFLQMWYASDSKKNKKNYIPGEYLKYIDVEIPELQEGVTKESDKKLGYVIPYGDGPYSHHNVAENVYVDLMNRANRYIHIMSPYFINDNEVMTAFKYAAERGTDVKLILPHIPDKPFAFHIARTYYPVLLKAGVKIYEYTPGFVHAKVFTSDDNKAIVGSINLDFRSLYHHFECATYIYRNPVVDDVERDFQETLKECQEVTWEYYKSLPLFERMEGHVMKLFAPMF